MLDLREFLQMRRIASFVAEILPDLEDLLEPSYGRFLQGYLECDSKIDIEIIVIVMGDERLRGGSTGGISEDGGLELHESLLRVEFAERRVESRFEEEAVVGFLIHDEIKVSLAVDRFLILDSVEFLRKGADRLRKIGEGGDEDRKLPLMRHEQFSFDSDVISDIRKLLDELESAAFFSGSRFQDGGLLSGIHDGAALPREHDLDIAGRITKLGEGDLSEAAIQHDPPCGLEARSRGYHNLFDGPERSGRRSDDIGDMVFLVEFRGIRDHSQILHPAYLIDPLERFIGEHCTESHEIARCIVSKSQKKSKEAKTKKDLPLVSGRCRICQHNPLEI